MLPIHNLSLLFLCSADPFGVEIVIGGGEWYRKNDKKEPASVRADCASVSDLYTTHSRTRRLREQEDTGEQNRT